MKEIALVTGCDRRYLSFLLDLLDNLRDLGIPRLADIYVFDIDFSEEERDRLSGYGVSLRRIEGEPIDITSKDLRRRHIVSTIRPVLPRIFPGHVTYVYLDVDTWMQDGEALEGLVRAAQAGSLVLAPSEHPAYSPWGPDKWVRVHGKFYPDAANEMATRRAWNAGVLAARGDSPAWAVWEREFRTAADRAGIWFGAGQAALTYLELTGELTPHALPATYNWTLHRALPIWDRNALRLVSPLPPFEPIHLVHETGVTKYANLRLHCADGTGVVTPLTYRGYRRLRAGKAPPDRAWRRISLQMRGEEVWPRDAYSRILGFRQRRGLLAEGPPE